MITRFIEPEVTEVKFETLSGTLTVTRKEDLFEMDFPAYELKPVEVTEEMIEAIGAKPLEAYMGRDLLCVMDSEKTVKRLNPDQTKLMALDGLLLQVTASGEKFDCVSRSFAPKCNVAEDPVCGSGHCHIFPFWADRLKKTELIAYQASKRGGILYGKMDGNRVYISGKAVLYADSVIHV